MSSSLYFVIGLIIGIALCVAFPGIPKVLNHAIAEAKKNKEKESKSNIP